MLRRNRRGGRARGTRAPRPRREFKGAGLHSATNPRLQLTRTGNFVPSRTRTSLRFGYELKVSASTSFVQQSFAGNSAADPSLSLGSLQPVGFDYWALMYDRYRVIGSRCELKLMYTCDNTLAARSATGTFVLWAADSVTTLTSISDAMAQPRAVTQDVTAQTPKRIVQTHKTSDILGFKNLEGSDSMQAVVSASPAQPWFWNLAIVSDAAYSDQSFFAEVVITYDVEFFQRAQLNRSTLMGQLVQQAYKEKCKDLIARTRKEAEGKREMEEKMLENLGSFVQGIQETKLEQKLTNDEAHDRWLKLRKVDPILMPGEMTGNSLASRVAGSSIPLGLRVSEPPTPPTSRSSSRK